MRCNNCGYTNTPTALRCDRCNFPLAGAVSTGEAQPTVSSPGPDPARTMKGDLPAADAWDRENSGLMDSAAPARDAVTPRKAPPNKFASTIDPSRLPGAAAVSLKLVRLPREGEQEVTMEFPGDRVNLDRENADPGNMAITSKGQALLDFQDGHWYITDTSALRTTYVRVAERTRINSGDVILLGDRAFRLE